MRRWSAKRAADADALAKVCSVLEPEESLRLVRSLADVDVLILKNDGQVVRSDGWHRLERPRPVSVPLVDDGKIPSRAAKEGEKGKSEQPATAPWSREHELVINFRDQPTGCGEGPLPAPVPGRLGRRQGRLSGSYAGALGIVRGLGAVSVAPRPETVVQERPGPQAC